MVNRRENDRDKSRRPGFVYKKRDPKVVKERAEQQGGNFDSIFKNGVDRFTPSQGSNQIRILPPTWDEHEHYGYDIWVHRDVGADNATYLCLNKMKGKRCPICEAEKELREDGEKDDADKIKAKKSTLVYILERDSKIDTPQVWQMSWTMDKDIAALCQNPKTGKVLVIDHPDHGYDVMFNRTGQKLRTRYSGIAIDRDESPIEESSKAQREILEFIQENPLPSLLNYYSAEHLETVLAGTAKEKDDDMADDDDDDKPRKKKRSREVDDDEDERPSKRKRSRDDDEDEDEKPRKRRSRDDDEDEEDEKPRRRKSRDDDDEDEEDEKPRRRKAKDDDEDEEDEDDKPRRRRSSKDDDDEDEEDEKPSRRRRSSKDDDDEDEEDEKPRKRRSSKDDDEDEEDEKPRKRRASKDDDDEEEEDEDDEKPSRRRRSRR